MPRLIFHPAADAELVTTAQYYEAQTTGLGADFLKEIQEALRSINQFPQAWPVLEAEVRRRLLKRFPYAVLYRVMPDHIRILAMADLRREPGSWRHRLTD